MPSVQIPPALKADLETVVSEAVLPNPDERIIQLRLKYRRAYAPWTPLEDEVLKKLSVAGLEIDELTALLCRQDGAIRARLNKLEGHQTPKKDLEVGLLRVTPEMATHNFSIWLEVVKAGGTVEVVQDGKIVARIVAAVSG